jgi:hypothetical protein
MQWEFTKGKPKEGIPARQALFKELTVEITPKPALPARDLFRATIDETNWKDIERGLVEVWVKTCEVIPQYFSGPEATATFDRLLCVVDVMNGFVRVQGRHGDELPVARSHPTVYVKLPFVLEAHRNLPDCDVEEVKWKDGYAALEEKLIGTLASAAECEPAKSSLARLMKWHPVEIMVMRNEIPDSIRALKA